MGIERKLDAYYATKKHIDALLSAKTKEVALECFASILTVQSKIITDQFNRQVKSITKYLLDMAGFEVMSMYIAQLDTLSQKRAQIFIDAIPQNYFNPDKISKAELNSINAALQNTEAASAANALGSIAARKTRGKSFQRTIEDAVRMNYVTSCVSTMVKNTATLGIDALLASIQAIDGVTISCALTNDLFESYGKYFEFGTGAFHQPDSRRAWSAVPKKSKYMVFTWKGKKFKIKKVGGRTNIDMSTSLTKKALSANINKTYLREKLKRFSHLPEYSQMSFSHARRFHDYLSSLPKANRRKRNTPSSRVERFPKVYFGHREVTLHSHETQAFGKSLRDDYLDIASKAENPEQKLASKENAYYTARNTGQGKSTHRGSESYAIFYYKPPRTREAKRLKIGKGYGFHIADHTSELAQAKLRNQQRLYNPLLPSGSHVYKLKNIVRKVKDKRYKDGYRKELHEAITHQTIAGQRSQHLENGKPVYGLGGPLTYLYTNIMRKKVLQLKNVRLKMPENKTRTVYRLSTDGVTDYAGNEVFKIPRAGTTEFERMAGVHPWSATEVRKQLQYLMWNMQKLVIKATPVWTPDPLQPTKHIPGEYRRHYKISKIIVDRSKVKTKIKTTGAMEEAYRKMKDQVYGIKKAGSLGLTQNF